MSTEQPQIKSQNENSEVLSELDQSVKKAYEELDSGLKQATQYFEDWEGGTRYTSKDGSDEIKMIMKGIGFTMWTASINLGEIVRNMKESGNMDTSDLEQLERKLRDDSKKISEESQKKVTKTDFEIGFFPTYIRSEIKQLEQARNTMEGLRK